MGLVVLLAIIALIGIGALIAAFVADMSKNARLGTAGVGLLLIIIFPAVFWLSGYTSVPTKSVGVVTSFGKVVGTPYQPGQHWLVPWKSLNIIQDTIQTDKYYQSNGSGNTYTNNGAVGGCITVRLGGNQEGCADVQLQTQVESSAIPELFGNYNSYGPDLSADIDQYVVYRELVTVLNHQLGDYNPIADVSATLASSGTASQFSTFDPALLSAMQTDLAGQVKVLNFNLQYVHYDQATQDRINQIATQYAETQVAVQQEKTNAAISAANAALVKQAQSLTPAVLTYDCLQTVEAAIKANYQLPTGFGCGSGGNLILSGK